MVAIARQKCDYLRSNTVLCRFERLALHYRQPEHWKPAGQGRNSTASQPAQERCAAPPHDTPRSPRLSLARLLASAHRRTPLHATPPVFELADPLHAATCVLARDSESTFLGPIVPRCCSWPGLELVRRHCSCQTSDASQLRLLWELALLRLPDGQVHRPLFCTAALFLLSRQLTPSILNSTRTRALRLGSPILEHDHARLADSLLQSFESPASLWASNTATISTTGPQSTAAGPSPTQAQGRMRSSIACRRCRRSKVKCVNSGVGTVCRACEHGGKDCEYPPPAVVGSRRREGSVSGKQELQIDPYRRPKQRKSVQSQHGTAAGLGSLESPRPMLDALDPRLLTTTVWQELFEIYQKQYSADLPFLHRIPFLKPLRNVTAQHLGGSMSSSDTSSDARPPGSDDFLLAFLALTARFHPRLVAHHSPPTASRPSNPLIASEYYANCANERQMTLWPEQENHTNMVEGIQAGLMLGLHDWGMCRGHRAWMRVGMCIRSAQSMGLQYEKDLDDEPNSRSFALDVEAERMGINTDRTHSSGTTTAEMDETIAQEVRRRTFWSCYIMDRYLSSGKYRPQMLFAPLLRTQLPASDRSFAFGEKVRTLMLNDLDGNGVNRAEVQSHRQAMLTAGQQSEPAETLSPNSMYGQDGESDKGRLQAGADEGLLSRYIKILEIYGKVVQWSCAGGRRTERSPPWDPRSDHYNKLLRSCQDFKASLPRNYLLTPQNIQSHITIHESTPYTLVHTVYLLCQIMLHREYVPFIPLRCKKPEGPLDPPLFPPAKYDVPPGYWEDSARQCFKAARDLVDLVRTCQEWNALVQTPIVGFAIYTVAFVGVYCINFPWMDPDGYMCTQLVVNSGGPPTESRGFEAARKALEIIGQMRPHLHMADGWFKTINKMHRYLRRVKKDFSKNVQANESASESDGSPTSSRQLSLREGGVGGGLDEYKLLERTLKEFGNLDDQDIEMTDIHLGTKPLDAIYDDNSNSGATVKSEEADRPSQSEPLKPDGPWKAINAAPGAGRPSPTSAPTSNGGWRSYDSMPGPGPGQPQSVPPSNYNQPQLNSFRPIYQHQEASVPPSGALPSLTSPDTRTASTSSQPSPSYNHQHHAYNAWTPHNASYSMQPPGPGYAIPQNAHAHTPINAMHAYPTPGSQLQPMGPPQLIPENQQIYDPMAKEAWLNSVNTGLGGDDVAAFVDGGEMEDWASMAATRGFAQGWLSTVWGGGNGAPG